MSINLVYHISKPSLCLQGRLVLDGSKSISNRVLLIRALCKEYFPIHNLSTSNDTKAMQNALLQKSLRKDVGAAGTTMRFLTAYLSSLSGGSRYLLTGSARMQERPIGILVAALRQLGADIIYVNKTGYPPLLIKGSHLSGGRLSIAADISSQYLSALLLIAPTLSNGLELVLEGTLVSRPYLLMTLKTMAYFGIHYTWEGNTISIAPQQYTARAFTVEADWSAASYYYAMAALCPAGSVNLQLVGLQAESLQGDSALVQLMEQFGVHSSFSKDTVDLRKTSSAITSFHYNFLNCPDIAQTLAVVCTGRGISGIFEGLTTLSIKETDRTAALAIELAKLGTSFNAIDTTGNTWQLTSAPLPKLPNSAISTYHDHRMAMSFAPLAICLKPGILIKDPLVVKKSYSDFWLHLIQLGYKIVDKII